jgi:ADP-ribosylglycohydrolase
MTLALAQSIIDSRGTYNHVLSIEYFIDWLTNGRFSTTDRAWDEGLSTRLALEIWEENGVDNLQHTQCLISQKLDAEHRSGNGSLMRIAPIGLIYWRDAAAARRLAREQSLVTHPSLACLEACEVYTELLCGVMRGTIYRASIMFFCIEKRAR